MELVAKIRKLAGYLLGKKSEVRDMDVKDAVLAKVVLDIHRKRTHTECISVPLFSVYPVHALDRPNALAETERRARKLASVKPLLADKKDLTRSVLMEYLPSISGIKVVRENSHSFISFEGNGRLAALQSVFSDGDQITIEVEEYHFRNSTKILRRMNRVRRLNGLL